MASTSDYIVTIILIIVGCIHLGMGLVKPAGNCYYEMLKARASVCIKEEESRDKFIVGQGVLMIAFAIIFFVLELK